MNRQVRGIATFSILAAFPQPGKDFEGYQHGLGDLPYEKSLSFPPKTAECGNQEQFYLICERMSQVAITAIEHPPA
jgi:hypothetical protein